MPVRDWKFRIADILEAVEESLEITRGMDYETFRQDKKKIHTLNQIDALLAKSFDT